MPHWPQRPTRHLVLTVLLLLPGLLVQAAGPARAQTVGCGTVITANITLTTDLLDCPGHGLVIGAPGITVDLGGHTISGAIISGGSPDQVGIDNSAGHDGVIIRNGVVRAFARGGVHLVGVDRSQVSDLQLDFFGDFGILLETGSRNRFTGNSLDSLASSALASSGRPRPAATT
jgi:hypothetical protein